MKWHEMSFNTVTILDKR